MPDAPHIQGILAKAGHNEDRDRPLDRAEGDCSLGVAEGRAEPLFTYRLRPAERRYFGILGAENRSTYGRFEIEQKNTLMPAELLIDE